MATLKVMPAMATVNGTTFTQIILTPLSPQRKQSPTILPKQEVVSSEQSLTGCATEPLLKLEYARQRGGQISKKAMNHPRPQAVTRRNTRERNRVRAVNQGFVTLANHVPPHLRSKKMSKVDTLKAAILYIQDLQETLDDLNDSVNSDSDSESTPSSLPSSPRHPQCTSPSQPITSASYHTYDQSQRLTQSHTTPVDSYHLLSKQDVMSHCPNGSLPSSQINNTFSRDLHYYDNYPNRTSTFQIDYSTPSCDEFGTTYPSPTSSFSSVEQGLYGNTEDISAEEAELLEFASWLY